ncbi:MAG TPA: SLC13 family permease [Pyrinomonadaceae bacterium]|nr:SLC13 family permease [Pyrinomonadaceae bacterium]
MPKSKLSAVLSEPESRFERARRAVGLVLAPLVFFALFFAPLAGLKPEAHSLAAVMAAVVVLWVTEALPLPATALLGSAACVVLKVAPAREVFAPYADPLIFLFIGSFIIARAIFLHGLDRRLAFGVLSIKWVGARPGRILVAFGAVTAFISAWISNTATTAMMFAIGMAILAFLFEQEREGGTRISRRYATGLMLMTSFAASIGGLATPIGTPPNVIGLGFIRELVGVEFPFFKWAMIGAPVVVVLFVYLAFYLNVLCRAGVREIEGSDEMLRRERERLGPWTRGQKATLLAFLVTVALWVVPGFIALAWGDQSGEYKWVNQRVPEAVAAVVGAVLLFLLPGDRARPERRTNVNTTADDASLAASDDGDAADVRDEERGATPRAMTWDEAVKIDWGVVLLYGGGFALGVLSFQTGLAEAVGRGLTGFLPVGGGLGLLFASTLVAVVTSDATSNTASANMVVPVVIAIARAQGADVLEPALGATMGASLGVLLPVSTPCNAIVYGSGYIPLARMIRYGLLLDIVGVLVIVAAVRLLAPLLS